jgi:TRAP-type C4-dicarboxylate transport system permease small subunit
LSDKFPLLERLNSIIILITHLSIGIVAISFLTIVIPFSRVSATTGFPIWMSYLIIPISFFMMIFSQPYRAKGQ